MNHTNTNAKIFPQIVASGRIVLATMFICCFLYTLAILGLGQALTPYTANGSLIRNEKGVILGSDIIAQQFSHPEYFWPRPSAVGYNASATGGSNLSPTNPKLRFRAKAIIIKMGMPDKKNIPADLVTSSGSGIDPHITLRAAEYQAERVASARGLSVNTLIKLLNKYVNRPDGALTPEPLVNVFLVNLALDRLGK